MNPTSGFSFKAGDIISLEILFIFSFNDENKIDKILKDRMHVIRTTGFKTDDKIKIFKNYLIPDLYKNYSLSENDIIFDDDIIKKIGEPYIKSKSIDINSNSGLGLGTFLGKTLLERQGANLSFKKNSDLGGALVTIIWDPKKLINS